MDFIEHLKSYLPENEIEKLIDSFNQPSKHAVLLNTSKITDKEFLNIYPNIEKHPIVEHAYIYNKEEYQLGKTILHELGAFYLQEPSAMLVSYLLHPSKDDLILDLCAAPGGKTVQSSFIMENKGLIISNDISNSRSQIILNNAERLGLANLFIINNDMLNKYQKYTNSFDKIILDAPCSGSGMFRKDEDVKEDWTYNKVLKNQQIQKTLISIAYDMLKPGGILSYSTCSFSKEEDEDVIQYLLDNSNAEILPIKSNPLFYNGINNIGVHIFPSHFPGEGHYICHIRKPGVKKENSFSFKEFNLKEFNISLKCDHIEKYESSIYASNMVLESKGLHIIRNGIKIGELNKGYYKFDLHLARSINAYQNEIQLSKEETQKYLKGEMLVKENTPGYILLKYNNMPIDFAKGDGKVIKNHYPKYRRGNYI